MISQLQEHIHFQDFINAQCHSIEAMNTFSHFLKRKKKRDPLIGFVSPSIWKLVQGSNCMMQNTYIYRNPTS